MRKPEKLAFVGYGEVGRLFSQQLRDLHGIAISAYDIKLADEDAAKPLIEAAEKSGVTLAAGASEAAVGADIVISAVTASAAEEVARQAIRYLTADQIFFDINSAAPARKARCGEALAVAGLSYVEGAVMAPVLAPGIRVPILTGGARAGELTEALTGLGMNLRAVSERIGRASATKLCRSIMIKGIEALIIDSARASAHWGVSEDVFGSLRDTFPSLDWAELAKLMDKRVEKHGIRRAAEMREAADMLRDMGRDPKLAEAVADSHERRARERE